MSNKINTKYRTYNTKHRIETRRKKEKIEEKTSEHYSYISPAGTVPIYFPIQNEPRLVRNAPQRVVSVDMYKVQMQIHEQSQICFRQKIKYKKRYRYIWETALENVPWTICEKKLRSRCNVQDHLKNNPSKSCYLARFCFPWLWGPDAWAKMNQHVWFLLIKGRYTQSNHHLRLRSYIFNI